MIARRNFTSGGTKWAHTAPPAHALIAPVVRQLIIVAHLKLVASRILSSRSKVGSVAEVKKFVLPK